LPEVVKLAVIMTPTLRLKRIKGREPGPGKGTVAVLDFVMEDPRSGEEPSGNNVLAFDWRYGGCLRSQSRAGMESR
jgi:hypothetical protein